jgi:hypothetical protein
LGVIQTPSATPQKTQQAEMNLHGSILTPSGSGGSGSTAQFGAGASVVYQDTIRGGCVSGSTCISFHPVHGPDGGTITFPPVPDDATPIFGYLYFQYLTDTDCSVDRIGDFVNATVNGVNINTVDFVEIGCVAADACFPAVATHFYRVDVSSLFDDCDLNVAAFELRGFGMGNNSDDDWVEGATLMVAYCSETSPATDVILVEHPQVYGTGVGSTPAITYSWSGFNASGASASLVLGIGNGQNFTGMSPGDENVSFFTDSTPLTILGETGTDGLFDGDLCGPGPFGNGGFYDNTIIDVTSLVNAGDSSATFTITGEFDCLDSNAAFLCVSSETPAQSCIPDACIEIGCFTLDFENDDGLTPLVHGQRLANGDPEFDGGTNFPVTITSSTNTAAILDSTNGPAAQDPDLLVDRGNVLILQTDANLSECPPASGVYCAHNDDEDGGTVSFEFPGPVEPASLVLIDIDAGDGTTTVVLTDSAAATRTFSVPANWTGDFATDGPPGWMELDLTTTSDQPGFGSTATAVDSAGFTLADVRRIDVHLAGSGAIDGLNWCETPVLAASASVRTGEGGNPSSLSPLTLPVLGQTLATRLDCAAQGSGLAVLELRRQPTSGSMTVYGEPLIQGPLVWRSVRAHSGSASQFQWNVPNDFSLLGVRLYAQGLCTRQSGSSGRVLQAGGRLSNAIDLVLGF